MKIVLRLSEAEKSERTLFAFLHWEPQEAGDEDVRMLLGKMRLTSEAEEPARKRVKIFA